MATTMPPTVVISVCAGLPEASPVYLLAFISAVIASGSVYAATVTPKTRPKIAPMLIALWSSLNRLNDFPNLIFKPSAILIILLLFIFCQQINVGLFSKPKTCLPSQPAPTKRHRKKRRSSKKERGDFRFFGALDTLCPQREI